MNHSPDTSETVAPCVPTSPADETEHPSSSLVPDDVDYHVGICPYFQRDRGRGLVYCECARFRFPDKEARREIVYKLCAHPDDYKKCVLKQMLDHYYERKYRRIQEQNKKQNKQA